MSAGSEPLRPQQRVDQVDQQAQGNERSERIVKDHDSFSSIPVDGMGVANRKCEETERKRNHHNVHHGSPLRPSCHHSFIGPQRWTETFSAIKRCNDHERPPAFSQSFSFHSTHRFSRRPRRQCCRNHKKLFLLSLQRKGPEGSRQKVQPLQESARGQKRRSQPVCQMSAYPLTAAEEQTSPNRRLGPRAVIQGGGGERISLRCYECFRRQVRLSIDTTGAHSQRTSFIPTAPSRSAVPASSPA
jgi:hypothetical protein